MTRTSWFWARARASSKLNTPLVGCRGLGKTFVRSSSFMAPSCPLDLLATVHPSQRGQEPQPFRGRPKTPGEAPAESVNARGHHRSKSARQQQDRTTKGLPVREQPLILSV